MTRTAKEEMKQDAKTASVCRRLVKELHISASESKKIVDGLIAKYGDNAYEVINASMVRPYDALAALGEKGRSSRRTLKFFLEKDLTNEQLVKALGKDKVKTKAKLGKEMKDDAAKAKSAKKDLPQNMASRQQKLDTKTKTKETKVRAATKSNIGTEFGFASAGNKDAASKSWKYPAWRPQTPEEKALETYEKISANNYTGALTFDELAEKAGVTKADLQALLNKKRTLDAKGELIASIVPGRTRDAFAKEAEEVEGKCGGKCLTGVQEMAVGVYGSDEASPINGARKEWKTDVEKAKGDNANSACNAHVLFDAQGGGITLTVPNLAFGQRAGSKQDKQMKAFNDKLPGGTIASTAHNRNSKGYAPNKSALHGHIWVKDNHGNSCSDGVQKNGPKDFNAYGSKVYVTLFKDDYFPKDLALQLIQQAQQRQELEQQQLKEKASQR